MISHFTIFGERCSGTNFLESAILENFKINSSNSNAFFNNSLVIKNEQYLEAINIFNGKSFWLTKTKLKQNSKILKITWKYNFMKKAIIKAIF